MDTGVEHVRAEWARLDAQLGLGDAARIRQVAQDLGLIPSHE